MRWPSVSSHAGEPAARIYMGVAFWSAGQRLKWFVTVSTVTPVSCQEGAEESFVEGVAAVAPVAAGKYACIF